MKGCPECKLFSLELVDDCFIWYGKFYKKYECGECFHTKLESD